MEKAPEDLALPAVLAEVAKIGFNREWDDETDESCGCDFEPYEHFEAPEETASWFRLWTGNDEVDGRQFRFFGSTAAGDYAGFWLVRPDATVTRQPVVFIGSEGELGVIAQDLGDLLWLFANGSGPAEAFDNPGRETQQNEAFRVIAERYAARRSRSTAEIVATARKEFPNFSELIGAMCR
ncbi:hypothetical protein N7532_002843 [Penicillium argentinense]|uniref:SMI1/KNR4 family protein n=1 Tax=Penicillium argentinense TaxID=1131581 RepID=A0A9W9G176_9EURO|nr:uncharacterized protein N7532_002843 [Penicillium argentinense]KAJ5110198.1 hypothetical protein N7532_002843 [Penicillium argentinense]